MHYAILYISLLTLQDYEVKLPNFTFCEGREHKISTPEKFAKIWQIERDRIRTTKFETTRIHILNDVFATVAGGGCLSSWMKETGESGELIVLGLTLVLANLTYQAIVMSRTCRCGVHSPISWLQQRKSVNELTGNEGSGTDWDWGDLLFCLRIHKPENYEFSSIFHMFSYLTWLSVPLSRQ